MNDGLDVFRDSDRPMEQRIDALLALLTPEEKCGQLLHEAPPIDRLGIPAYTWWNECLHGVARAGVATVFPQAIGLAAMWDAPFLGAVAEMIGNEGRAKHHDFLREGDTGYYTGLTFWTPNINIFRDPRWGRGQETYGECPHLTGRLGVAFIRGLQGNDPVYLRAAACAKHFAVHSGPEGERHRFNARVSEKDLRETYLPAFADAVREGGCESVMGAYNRTNGEVCCGSKTLLQKILRKEWGFTGHVVSDCWAIRDFHEHHGVTANAVQSAALAIRNGCDLNCGCVYEKLTEALGAGLISEDDLDCALRRLLRTRLRLGMFDPPDRVPYAATPLDVNDCAEHRAAARKAARRSAVLLKNDGVLPLGRGLTSIAVIGPNADSRAVLLGNYNGTPSRSVTLLEGIRTAAGEGIRVGYAEGCRLTGTRTYHSSPQGRISEAVSLAKRSDVVVLALGLDADHEGEEGSARRAEATGDRVTFGLLGLQQPLLEAVTAVGKPVVLVLFSGGAMDVRWADTHCSAILQAWYPGEEGGSAVADLLFGVESPAGRLPVTFYRSVEQLPDFRDYAMRGRTYRYLESDPLYPFGFGLSYTTFSYRDLRLGAASVAAGETVEVTADVCNTGPVDADEVVQLYVRDEAASCTVPHHELRGFQRIHLVAGASTRVRFHLTPRDLSLIDERGQRMLEPGCFTIFVGGSQPDARSVSLMGRTPLAVQLQVTGDAPVPLPY